MAMKPNSKAVLEYLKETTAAGANVTATDVAKALDLGDRTVNGIFTSAIQKKGYGERIPAEVELSDGSHKSVKFLRLTEAGMALDPDADEPAPADAE